MKKRFIFIPFCILLLTAMVFLYIYAFNYNSNNTNTSQPTTEATTETTTEATTEATTAPTTAPVTEQTISPAKYSYQTQLENMSLAEKAGQVVICGLKGYENERLKKELEQLKSQNEEEAE